MSIFHSVSAFFKKVFVNQPSWTKTAQIAITVAAPMAETLATLAGGAEAGSEAAKIADIVTTDLGVINGTLSKLHQQPADAGQLQLLRASLESVKENLPGLLQLAAVKNPNSKDKATLAANTIIGELEAVLAVIPAAS